MLICIDYDDTYTRDVYMWNSIIQVMKRNGHRVICATMRFEQEGDEVKKSIGQLVDEIHFTGRQAKMVYLSNINISPDIWIDDKPAWLFVDG